MPSCIYCDVGDKPEFMGDGYYHANGAAVQARCTRISRTDYWECNNPNHEHRTYEAAKECLMTS